MQEYRTTINAVANDEGSFDLDVKTELESHDKLAAVLLLVVEQLTGVSTDGYIAEVDSHRVKAGS